MIVYRITHKKWAETLQASGFAARWNSNGIFMLYTSESMALACLENIVHRKGLGLNANFEVMHIKIPSNIKPKVFETKQLPIGWNDLTERGQLVCRKIGDDWVRSGESLMLKVPSVIIPTEHNILINCNHKDFSKVKVASHHLFTFDERLKS